jgi:hypothetical protein
MIEAVMYEIGGSLDGTDHHGLRLYNAVVVLVNQEVVNSKTLLTINITKLNNICLILSTPLKTSYLSKLNMAPK